MTHASAPWQRPQPIVTNFTAAFWEATKRKEFVLQYCPVSKKFQHYPRPISMYTGRRNLEWRPVSGFGTVYAMTVTRRGPLPFRGREPYVVAMIDLDEGVRFMSNIVNVEPEAVTVGMRVQLAWDALAGGFHYPVFEPLARVEGSPS